MLTINGYLIYQEDDSWVAKSNWEKRYFDTEQDAKTYAQEENEYGR